MDRLSWSPSTTRSVSIGMCPPVLPDMGMPTHFAHAKSRSVERGGGGQVGTVVAE